MWPFKKKRVLEIPEDEVRGLLELIDTYNAVPRGRDHVAKYCVWRRIQRLLPETKEGKWEYHTLATRIIIEEVA